MILFVFCSVSLAEDVYVVSQGFHSGICIPTKYISKELLSDFSDFEDSKFIEFGYGDRDYYMSKTDGSGLALKALLWPTASVLHAVPIKSDPYQAFASAKILKITLSKQQVISLARNLSSSFTKKRMNPSVGSGLYLGGSFYKSKGKFHVFNTCNMWVAKNLKRSGLQINTFLLITQSSLFRRLRRAF